MLPAYQGNVAAFTLFLKPILWEISSVFSLFPSSSQNRLLIPSLFDTILTHLSNVYVFSLLVAAVFPYGFIYKALLTMHSIQNNPK